MSVPIPPTPLTGHCAAIDSNTLYVYDADAFQSLPISKNATWSQESIGQSVTTPACATVVPEDDASSAAMYVIGGESNNTDFSGLQRYFFGNKTWETLSPPVDVFQGRTNHSAAYLNDSSSILVYGGSTPQAPSFLSSQTFLISTNPPYEVQSYTSLAPPANNPILVPWNSSHAVMVGGEVTTNQVWLFGPDNGWQQLATNLSNPVDPAARGILVDGTDGSKVLQIYDFHVSPNTVQEIVLLGTGGTFVADGVTVGNDSSLSNNSTTSATDDSPSRKRKRDLTLENWPAYNSTNVPTSTRTDCSLTKDSTGLLVMAGGNSDEPVLLFNQVENSWVDANKFFDSQQPLVPTSSTPSSTATPTDASPTASTSASAAPIGGGETAHQQMLRTLGTTLGVLCGIAVLLILALLYTRWRKTQARKKRAALEEEKARLDGRNRMSFADRGASFMKEANLGVNELPPPGLNTNHGYNPHSSLAIIAGRLSRRITGSYQGSRNSGESTVQLVKDGGGNIVPMENVEMRDIGEKPRMDATSSLVVPRIVADGSLSEGKARRKRSSGWSKYFATSSPTERLSHLPSAYVVNKTKPLSMTSQYSVESSPSIPPSTVGASLDVDFGKSINGQRLSNVPHGSPAFSDSREEMARRGSSVDIQDGESGVIVDPSSRRSQATSVSSYGNRSTLSSTLTSDYFNEAGQAAWTPMAGLHRDERPTSSNYTSSVYDMRDRLPSRGKGSGFFPGSGASYKSTKTKFTHSAAPTSDWATPADWAPPKMPAARAEENRDSLASDITVFPSAKDFDSPKINPSQSAAVVAEPAESAAKPTPTDMSWLNLKG